MCSIEVYKIATVLQRDYELLRRISEFRDHLGTPSDLRHQFEVTINRSDYDNLNSFISSWVERNGRDATVSNLALILDQMGLQSCAEKLRNFTTGLPRPVLIITSTIAAHANQMMPISFGFQPLILNFIGRKAELKKLYEFFLRSHGVVISGLGGIGKTELSKAFCLQQKNESTNPIISWFAGENSEVLQNSLMKFCKYLNLSVTNSDGNTLEILELLERCLDNVKLKFGGSKWIVIADNVDEVYEDFKSFVKLLLQNPNIFLIVTSRRRDIFPGELSQLPLLELNVKDSMEFIRNELNDLNEENNPVYDEKSVRELCQKLQNFPLALQQVVAYIKQQHNYASLSGMTVKDYLRELAETEISGLNTERELSQYSQTTLKVWNVTFSKISGENPLAVKVLNVLAFLNPDAIDIQFILKISNDFNLLPHPEMEEGAKNKLLEHALVRLRLYSLIKVSFKTISIHRLVQLAVRVRMQEQKLDIPILSDFWEQFQANNYTTVEFTHILIIWKHTMKYPQLLSKVSQLADKISVRLCFLGMFNEDYAFSLECYKIFKVFLGENHLETLRMEGDAYSVLIEKGLYKQALEKLTSVHRKDVVILGESHPETMSIAHNITTVLIHMMEFSKALEMGEYLLGLKIEVHGEQHESTLVTKSNVAKAMEELKMFKKAKKLSLEVYKSQMESLGENHADTLSTKFNIACLIRNEGRLEESYEMFENVLEARREVLGDDHHETINTKSWLATLLMDLGKKKKSLEMFQDVLLAREKILGEQHADTIYIRNEIKKLLQSKNNKF